MKISLIIFPEGLTPVGAGSSLENCWSLTMRLVGSNPSPSSIKDWFMTKRQKQVLMVIINSHPQSTALTTPDIRVANNIVSNGWAVKAKSAIPQYSLTEAGIKACKAHKLMY